MHPVGCPVQIQGERKNKESGRGKGRVSAVMSSHLLLGIVACTSAVFGILFNGYIILVLVYTRQMRTANNLLLLHLALVDILSCLEMLSMTTPSAISEHWSWHGSLCLVHGFIWTTLLPVVLWTLCGLNCDRYAAIASPLHYSRLVRSKLIVAFLALTWVLSVSLAVPPLLRVNQYSYHPSRAICTADFTDGTSGLWYPIIYTSLSLVLPALLIFFCNFRILAIARHHRHRIVSAIYEVTLRAQATITHQRNPFYLSKYKGRCAIITIIQLVGSLTALYGLHCSVLIWEMATGKLGSPTVAGLAMGLVTCSPLLNGFVYGVKSRALRKTFKNFLRRQLYTSEVHNEIQRRGSVVSHNTWASALFRIHNGTNGTVPNRFRALKHHISPASMNAYRLQLASKLGEAGNGHVRPGLGLASIGIGLTLGIGLTISDSSSDSGDLIPLEDGKAQYTGLANHPESPIPLTVPLQSGNEISPALHRIEKPNEASAMTKYHSLPNTNSPKYSVGPHFTSESNVKTDSRLGWIVPISTAAVTNDKCHLVVNGTNPILQKSLDMLCLKKDHRSSNSVGLHLELLPIASHDMQSVQVLPARIVERGSI